MGVFATLGHNAAQSFAYVEPNLRGIGFVGFIGFPLYFIIWHDIFPQPYESLPLRMIGCILFFLLAFADRWPVTLRRFLPAYWYISVLFALPYFFTLMLLKNNSNIIWTLSLLCAVFLLVIVLDWLNAVVQFVIGSAAAIVTAIAGGTPISFPPLYWEYLPIFSFALVSGSVFSFAVGLVRQEKLNAVIATGASIAHELRTPLAGLRAAMIGAEKMWPTLIAGHREAVRLGSDIERLPPHIISALEESAASVRKEIDDMSTIIDMLLMKVSLHKLKSDDFAVLSMAECAREAAERYPYKSGRERSMVSLKVLQDFEIKGIRQFMVHVLYNLIKNAIYAVSAADRRDASSISIEVYSLTDKNLLRVADNGIGMPECVLEKAFDWFYSNKNSDTSTGIGLPFCKMIVESFSGTIEARSLPGVYTEFLISFPKEPEQ